MESLWSAECQIEKRNSIGGDMEVNTVVVGAGMAGILTAYLLQEKGVQVIVVEANRIASGMTQNTTAKITSQHNLIYDRLIKEAGIEKAQQYANANQEAIGKYKEIIEKLKIECHFVQMPSFVYTLNNRQKIKNEYEAALKLGIDAEYTEKVELPFTIDAAVKFNHQAQFNPLEFIKAISEKLRIYEETMVKEVQDNLVITDKGAIKAKNVIIATHYPFINVPGYYFLRLFQKRSYVLALEQVPLVNGMYKDENEDGYSFRTYKDLLLFGGGGHKTGEKRDWSSYEKLRNAAKKYYPEGKEVYHWSAQDCTGLDEIPYIGKYSTRTPNLYVATGFNKWGMTSSMVSAMILSDIICGIENKNAEVFTPHRFNITASAKNLYAQGKETVKSLVLKKLVLPDLDITNIKNGTGAVVDYQKQKVGVFKDESGRAYFIAPVCAHLGCQVEWNQDELTWDCPCHGSRYDYMGRLIDNPAMADLEHW